MRLFNSLEVCFLRDLKRKEVEPNQNMIDYTTFISISTTKPKVSNGTVHRFCWIGPGKVWYFQGVDLPGDKEGQLEIPNQQTAVVRTNCMDCSDRANVVQSMIARWTMTRQLLDVGVLQPGQSQDDELEFRDLFRNVWADNADVVSNSYSGTGALKTDFTRTGDRTKAGIFQDGEGRKSIKLVKLEQGKHPFASFSKLRKSLAVCFQL